MLIAPTFRANVGFLFLAFAIVSSILRAQSPFEVPPTLQASELVEASLLEGPNHRVEAAVVNDGRMNHFVIQSDFGEFHAYSEPILRVRISEVGALAKLKEISRTEAFAKALASTALQPVEAVEQVVTHPVATAKGLPGGLGRAFRGLYYRGRKVAEKVSPEDDKPGDAKDDEKDPEEAGSEEDASSSKDSAASSAAKSYLGFNSARRELAASVGVDPYSTNAVLQKELTRLAQAATAGGLSFSQMAPGVSVPLHVEEISDVVWNTPVSELERLNDEALEKMGVSDETRSEFREHPFFTPTARTIVRRSLERLAAARRRDSFIAFAVSADSLEAAELITQTSRVLARYSEQEGPIQEIRLGGNDEVGRLILGVDESGRLVVPIAFDYLIWQAGMEQRGPLYRFEERFLWSSGRLSPRARRELEARGWNIEEQVLPRAANAADEER